MFIAITINFNIWISHYIKVGIYASNPFVKYHTKLYDKYFAEEIIDYDQKIKNMKENSHYWKKVLSWVTRMILVLYVAIIVMEDM